MPFYINTQKQYKIWFSTDPNEFLGLENELALIRTRLNNPIASITLVYSRRCLNIAAQKKLARFCKQYNIVPFDFDSQLQPLIKDNSDNTLYLMAQLEITLAMKGPIGNMGVASDFARVIVPLMEHCGIYCDFDVQLKFKHLPGIYEVKAPVIFPIFTQDSPEGESFLYINNEFLAGSIDPKNGSLHNECIIRMRNLQQRLIYNYQHFSKETMLEMPLSIPAIQNQDRAAIDDFFETHKKPNLFDFRAYIDQLDIIQVVNMSLKAFNSPESYAMMVKMQGQSAERYARFFASQMYLQLELPFDKTCNYVEMANRFIAKIKHTLLQCTAGPLSGAGNYHFLNHPKLISEIATEEGRLPLLKCGLTQNNLHKHLYSCQRKNEILFENVLQQLLDKIPHREIGETGDQSWTPIGKSKKQGRDQIIRNAGKRMLNNWRMKKACLGHSLMDLKINGPKKPEIELKFNVKHR